MKSRERVVRAINFDYPDRPPISHAILPSAIIHHGTALQAILKDVHEDFGWDFLPDLPVEKYPPYYRQGRNYDGFGTLWECSTDGEYGVPIRLPFADFSSYASYTWPDFEVKPVSYRLYSGHMCHTDGINADYYARGAWIQFFEEMQQLRGFENLLADIGLKTKEAYQLRDGLLDFNLASLDKWLAWKYDGIHFADDWGTQLGLLISPELWREFFKPAYKKMFQKVIDSGVDVHFHSDGYILDIIPDLLEIGVKVLNCQSNIMGNDVLGKRFKGKFCFRTDLDRQKVMVFGTPQDVKKHIRAVFSALGSEKGGVIACGEIGRDTPLDNIKAMYEEFMNFKF
ncbi:MAG: uroporphyrinogen decarboxylase family protein [Spirochaetota bacterium]